MQVNGVRALTYSEIRTWKQCRYRHNLSYVQRFAANEKASYFKRGSAVHRFIEMMHTQTEPVVIDTLIKQMRREWEDAIAYEFYLLHDEKEELPALSDDDKEEMAVLEGMIRAYHKHYFLNNEFAGYLAEIEVSATIGDAVSWAKIDGIVKLKSQMDAYWIHEIKTAKSFSETDRKLLNIDDQSHHYLMTVQEKWPDKKFAGAIRTIIKAQGIKQTKKESVDEYCERVVADYQERPDFYLSRFYLDKPMQVVEEYRNYFQTIYKEIVLSTFAPKSPGIQSCGMCDFFEYCTEPNEQVKDELLKRDFYVRGSTHSAAPILNDQNVQQNRRVA